MDFLLDDRRFKVGGLVLAGGLTLVSLGLVAASKMPSHFKPLPDHLPAHALNIPYLRGYPEPMEKLDAPRARSIAAPRLAHDTGRLARK